MNDPIEEALGTYPMVDVPPDFSKRVMEQIRLTPTRIGFHLTWMDYALGLFLSLIPALGFIVWAFLPRQFFMLLQYEWLVLQSPAYEPILLASLAAAGLCLILAFVASLSIFNRLQRISV